jgi:hypothetical protein
MKTAKKRVAIYVMQYNGTWGWEPVEMFRVHKNALSFMQGRRAQACMNRAEEKRFRVVRYLPEDFAR